MTYWLMKSEPSEVGIDDLADMPNQTVTWFGVRNYQARNFMKDQMKIGDRAFFYHSSCPAPGIVGIVEICSPPYPDATQFDSESKYYDPKSSPDSPRWFNVDVRLVSKNRLVSLSEMRSIPALQTMRILSKGNRLSITPVTENEWSILANIISRL